MHKAIVEINKVPTTIETWGRWIEETPTKENEDIVICIPGNPGVTGYYRKFLETIYNKLQCPVWIIGHAGHQKINSTSVCEPAIQGNESLYNLQGQIDNKVEFFRKYVPAGVRVHLIGHSVGAYISLNLLNHADIKAKVVKAYLLFPTIENIGDTPNGKFMTNIIQHIVWLILFLSWIFTCLPDSIQTILLQIYFKVTGNPSHNVPHTKKLIHPTVLQNIFYMAFDEMKNLRNLNPDLLRPHKDVVKLYYGATDNWAPVSQYKKISREYPDVNTELCVRNFDHAFVLRSSEEVGNMVASWIEVKN